MIELTFKHYFVSLYDTGHLVEQQRDQRRLLTEPISSNHINTPCSRQIGSFSNPVQVFSPFMRNTIRKFFLIFFNSRAVPLDLFSKCKKFIRTHSILRVFSYFSFRKV